MRLEKLVYCHYNMRLKIKCIRERQRRQEQRLTSLRGRPWPSQPEMEADIAGIIDVDELLDEEHPLNAWVETRAARDVPEFDPQDRAWAEGELDGVEARDPELRVREDAPIEKRRHSSSQPERSKIPTSQVQPQLRRAATQKEGKQGESSKYQDVIYMRQKKRRVLTQPTPASGDDDETLPPESQVPPARVDVPIRTHDSTQDSSDDDDDDDDGAAAGAATGATGAAGGHEYAGYTGPGFSTYVPETEHEGGGGGGGGEGQGGYEGQQRQAAYDWPPWEPHHDSGSSYNPQFQFQPPTLPYSDLSSSPLGVGAQGGWAPWPDTDTSEATSSYRPTGIWCKVSSQSGESSSQGQAYTPRGIQRGMHDLANSLFSYGYQPMQTDETYGGSNDDRSSQSGWQF